jgi:hypothetical protein
MAVDVPVEGCDRRIRSGDVPNDSSLEYQPGKLTRCEQLVTDAQIAWGGDILA